MADSASIKAKLRSAFRDFRVEGVPSSGENEPVKSEIRAALDGVVDLVQVAGTTKVVATVADLAGLEGVEPGGKVEVRADPGGDAPDHNGVWRKNDGPGYTWISPIIPASVSDRLDAVDEQLVDAAFWEPSPNAVMIGEEEAQAVFTDDGGGVRLAFMANGRVHLPRENNLSQSDPQVAGAKVMSDGETIVLSAPRTGSGESTYVRGRPRRAGLPDGGVISFMGQSNAGAAEAGVVTSSDVRFGDFMMGQHVQTWERGGVNRTTPVLRAEADLHLLPLQERDEQVVARHEFGAFGVSAQLKITGAGGRFVFADLPEAGPHLVFHCASTGGRRLSELVKGAGTGHYETWLDDVTRAKGMASRRGLESFAVLGVVWDQGEAESDMKLVNGGPALTWDQVRTGYAASFGALVDQATTDAKAVTGQPRLPFFLTQMRYGPAADAHVDICDQRDDCFLVGPRYQMPSALNVVYRDAVAGLKHGDPIHMAADGQRWRGEMVGKVMRRVLTEGRDWEPLRPVRLWRVDGQTIRIQFYVPAPPIRISDVAQAMLKHRGFAVFAGTWAGVESGTRLNPTSFEVVAPDVLEIKLAESIGSGAAYVRYGLDDWIDDLAPITSVRGGAAYPNGKASTEYVLAGDHTAALSYALRYGAVKIANATGWAYVRSVRVEGGSTVLKGWTEDRFGLGASAAATTLARDIPGGNLCDSDDSLSVFSFTDPTYGARQGEPYPLNNHCIVFREQIA